MLNETNFKVRNEVIEIVIGGMNFDLTLRPTSTTETSNEAKIEKCDLSHHHETPYSRSILVGLHVLG